MFSPIVSVWHLAQSGVKNLEAFHLVGSLGQFEARGLPVFASHPQITGNKLVRLAFAWTQAEDAPLIFGQMNFFMEFDVCFYRSQGVFEIHPKNSEIYKGVKS
jgi:hypothetical protein